MFGAYTSICLYNVWGGCGLGIAGIRDVRSGVCRTRLHLQPSDFFHSRLTDALATMLCASATTDAATMQAERRVVLDANY